jgi:hypothetical protein
MTISELKDLWQRLLGDIPNDTQFQLWISLHSIETVRHGILKTSVKNQSSGGRMSADHKVRFASAVMNGYAQQKATNINIRRRLA